MFAHSSCSLRLVFSSSCLLFKWVVQFFCFFSTHSLFHAETGSDIQFSGFTQYQLGLQWGEMGENNLGDCCFCFLICYCIVGVFGIYIIPNWLIKVPAHIPILFRWFRALRTFRQNLDPETSELLPRCFKKYKKNMESSWRNIIYVNMGFKKSKTLEKLYVFDTTLFDLLFVLFSICLWKFDYIFRK